MSTHVKARTAAKGWATRTSRKLETLCADKNVDPVELSDAMEEFDIRLGALDEAQSQVELELDPAQLEDDIEGAADFRESVRKPRIKAAKILKKLNQDADTKTTKGSVDVKLPKLELPSFSGNVVEWQSFWDQFIAVIDESDLPDINKFTYLQSLLVDEAKAAIQGLSLTASNYKIACDILKERFGRKERIIFQHIQDLLNIAVPSEQCSVTTLWNLCDDLKAHVRSLESLEVNGDQYGVVLTPLILSRLPHDIRLEWAREGQGHESDLEWLLKFLEKEIQRRERSQSFKDILQDTPQAVGGDVPSNSSSLGSASALQISSRGQCGFCSKRHPTSACRELSGLSVPDIKGKIYEAGLCFRCLGQGHIARSCSQTCARCKGRHHIIVCQGISEEGASSHTTVSHIGMSNVTQQSQVVLQTAQVSIQGEGGLHTATVLFDTGSDRTYIAQHLVEKIKPAWVGSQSLAYAAFGSKLPSAGKLRNTFEVSMKDALGGSHTIHATEVPVICAAVYRPQIPSKMMGPFLNLQLVESQKDGKPLTVDMLIGLDHYWQLVQPGIVQGPEGLVAQKTVFGWMVSGTLGTGVPGNPVSHQLLCLNNVSESTLSNFWDLETIGIIPERETPINDPLLDEFQDNLRFREGRYEVGLPWKEKSGKLLNNEKLARKRLDSLTIKLERDPSLASRYREVFTQLEEEGIVEEVPPQEIVSIFPTYYLPHRPVVKEESTTTKIRPVFDASAAGYNGVSLNDCLETGPCLTPNLSEILIRFRRWKVALTGDITKAFLQIGVRREDQDVHRFLLKDVNHTRIMRFTRVPFGNKSSPFLLNATIKSHLQSLPPSRVVDELTENLYVDDWLSGADDDQEACAMLEEASQCMAQAGMSLAKWGSNSGQVSEKLYQEWEGKHYESNTIKVLGLKWVVTEDCFSFEKIDLPSCLCVTK